MWKMKYIEKLNIAIEINVELHAMSIIYGGRTAYIYIEMRGRKEMRVRVRAVRVRERERGRKSNTIFKQQHHKSKRIK